MPDSADRADRPKPVQKRLAGDYIGQVLKPATRKSLIDDLMNIFRSADDGRAAQFLLIAEEEIDSYRKLTVPVLGEQKLLPEQFDQLEKAGRQFHEAVRAIGPIARSWIAQTQSIMLADRGAFEVVQFEQTLEAAERAEFMAEAIVHIRKLGWRRWEGAAISALMENMAVAYEGVFGQQPSAAREGHFMKATAAILEAANLPTIGENAVRRILRRAQSQFLTPRPRRGRKPRKPERPAK